jgi:hypothetical protein
VTPREVAVETVSRWDAIDLLRRLQALRTARTYMIQGAPDRWVVYAQPTPRALDGGDDGGVFEGMVATIERWLDARQLETCEVRLDGRAELFTRPSGLGGFAGLG